MYNIAHVIANRESVNHVCNRQFCNTGMCFVKKIYYVSAVKCIKFEIWDLCFYLCRVSRNPSRWFAAAEFPLANQRFKCARPYDIRTIPLISHKELWVIVTLAKYM